METAIGNPGRKDIMGKRGQKRGKGRKSLKEGGGGGMETRAPRKFSGEVTH